MREFFRGWKRKTGCVTLIAACLFTIGWVRSGYVTDALHFRFNRKTVGEISSSNEGCYFIYLQMLTEGDLSGRWAFTVREERRAFVGNYLTPGIAPPGAIESGREDARLIVNWLGVYAGTSHSQHFGKGIVVVPYWLIVLPLTLLSAYLL